MCNIKLFIVKCWFKTCLGPYKRFTGTDFVLVWNVIVYLILTGDYHDHLMNLLLFIFLNFNSEMEKNEVEGVFMGSFKGDMEGCGWFKKEISGATLWLFAACSLSWQSELRRPIGAQDFLAVLHPWVCEVMSGMTSGVCVESDLSSMLQRGSAPSHHHPNHHGYGGQAQVSGPPGANDSGVVVFQKRLSMPVSWSMVKRTKKTSGAASVGE